MTKKVLFYPNEQLNNNRVSVTDNETLEYHATLVYSCLFAFMFYRLLVILALFHWKRGSQQIVFERFKKVCKHFCDFTIKELFKPPTS